MDPSVLQCSMRARSLVPSSRHALGVCMRERMHDRARLVLMLRFAPPQVLHTLFSPALHLLRPRDARPYCSTPEPPRSASRSVAAWPVYCIYLCRSLLCMRGACMSHHPTDVCYVCPRFINPDAHTLAVALTRILHSPSLHALLSRLSSAAPHS